MIGCEEQLFSDASELSANGAATIPLVGWAELPADSRQMSAESSEVSRGTLGASQAGLAGAAAIAHSPERPAAFVRRIRKAPARQFSLVEAGLAAGREIVGPEGNRSAWYLGLKRSLDIVGAVLLLLVLSPVMLTTYLVLLFTTRGKPIFRQERLGYRGRRFTMYKFRTMRLDAAERQREVENEKDGPIFKNRRDPRVTRLGRLLRSTSIDETPQLFKAVAAPPPDGQTGADLSVAGERAFGGRLQAVGPHGSLVREEPEPFHRPDTLGPDPMERAQPARGLLRGMRGER